MDHNTFAQKIQKYLERVPLVILGSGSSMAYGLPSMGDLCEHIENLQTEYEDPNFFSFVNKMKTDGLESAWDNSGLLSETAESLRIKIWEVINKADIKFFHNYAQTSFDLVNLIEKLLAPAPHNATIITTNYDRLVEFATDYISATAVTGFEGNLIRKHETISQQTVRKRISARERFVNILKVHGSLDWFRNDNDDIVSFPFSQKIVDLHTPLIIPPCQSKYQETHNEPYRSIISHADAAFNEAHAYFCVGYGFNDAHIQPLLIENIKKGKPIVILAKKASSKCLEYVKHVNFQYFILEESDCKNTTIYSNQGCSTLSGALWRLDNFLKIW